MVLDAGSGSGGGTLIPRNKTIFGQNPEDIRARFDALFSNGGSPDEIEALKQFIASQAQPNQDLADLLQGNAGMPSNDGPAPNAKNPFRSSFKDTFRDAGMPPIEGGNIEGIKRPALKAPVAEKQEVSALDQLFGTLLDSVGQGGSISFDYETALRQSEDAIRDAYQADIGAIRGQNKGARRETARDRQEIERMYNKLARSYERSGKRSMRQGRNLSEEVQGLYNDASGNVEQTASDIASQQAALAQGLGIEEAFTDIIPEQSNNTMDMISQIQENGADGAARMLGYAGNNRRFMERGAQGARLEGVQESGELLGALQDFIQGNKNQISNLRAQRRGDLLANEQSVNSTIAEMQASADSEQWDRLMQLAGLKLDIENTQIDNDLAAQKLAADLAGNSEEASADYLPKFMQQYAGFLQNEVKNPKRQGIINDILDAEDFRRGTYEAANGEFVDMNPQSAAAVAEEIAREQGITDPQFLAKIRMAAMIQAQGT